MTFLEELEEQVNGSAKWLDSIKPRWAEFIDFDELHMFSNCILDMVFDPEAKLANDYYSGYTYAHDKWHDATDKGAFAVNEAVPYWRNAVEERL